LRVLYLHPAAAFGGASKSLIELFGQLRTRGVTATVLVPAGSACVAFAQAGMEVRSVKGLSQFDNTRYGHYRRLRWIILLRELFLLPFSLHGLWRLRQERFDLIHVNEVTLLPLGLLAKWLLGIPLVVHVRSLQRKPNSGWRSRMINGWLRRYADAVVAIDHTVAGTLETGPRLHVVHNGLKVDISVPLPCDSGVERETSAQSPVRVGFLGVLIPLKGVYDLVEAMRILKQRGVLIECLVAGDNVRELSGLRAWALRKLDFSHDVRAELEDRIVRYGLQPHVKLLGFVDDVRALYPQLDILCFPSHLDAAGRPVFEAAFYGIPSVVVVANPMPDAILHGVTGLAIPSPDPVLLADALQRLAEDADYRKTLGRQARDWANENFAIDNSAASMQAIYQQLVHQHDVKAAG